MNSGKPAGWYSDPGGSPMLRWWDGSAWTDNWKGDDKHAASTAQAVNAIAVVVLLAAAVGAFFGVLWLLENMN